MEADNFLADKMKISRPEYCLFILRAADSAEIGGQRIEPDVKDVRLFARDRNTPTNCGACDAEIPEAAFDKAENLVAARFGLNEIPVLGIPIEKRFLKGREFEKVICFGDRFCGPAAIGTVFAGLYVHVGIVVDAVLPGVVTGIDETVFAAQLEKPLHGVRVFQVGGA